MKITLDPKDIRTRMLILVATLAVLHIQQLILYFMINDPNKFDFIRLLDFDYEGNLPSIYSMLAILCCSLTLFLIANAKKQADQPFQFHWLLLGWVFLFLSIDEGAAVHEEIGDLTELFVDASGFLYFPWVIPYVTMVVVLTAFYFRFLLHLPKPTLIRFIIAAGLFLTGAVGIEIFSAREADINGTETILYSALYTMEEICEMVAMVIFLHALLEYYQREFGTLTVKIAE